MFAVKNQLVNSAVVTQLGKAQLAQYVCSTGISWYSVPGVVIQLVQSDVKIQLVQSEIMTQLVKCV
jgi:hypothetical protein